MSPSLPSQCPRWSLRRERRRPFRRLWAPSAILDGGRLTLFSPVDRGLAGYCRVARRGRWTREGAHAGFRSTATGSIFHI
jgi:hypothetical protein